MLGLLGPNGAGKTTTVRILATLLSPDGGRARVAGLDVVEQAAAVRRLIGLSGQYAAVDSYLTGRENLQMIGRLYGLGRRAARLLGIVVRDAGTAGLAGLFPVIILTFTSSTLVPVATMPGWLQAFANVNPITVMVGALRVLCLGGPTARPVAEALAWIIGLLLVTVPIAVNRYRRAASA